MYLIFHGAKCCAIRHIHSMGQNPDEKLPAYTPPAQPNDDPDQCGESVNSMYEMQYGKRPEETRTDRLKFFLDYLKSVRPGGIVEICLAQVPDQCDEDCDCYDDEGCDCTFPADDGHSDQLAWCYMQGDQRMWFPVLEELGFKRVSVVQNSNSGNIVTVFHLVMEGGKILV